MGYTYQITFNEVPSKTDLFFKDSRFCYDLKSNYLLSRKDQDSLFIFSPFADPIETASGYCLYLTNEIIKNYCLSLKEIQLLGNSPNANENIKKFLRKIDLMKQEDIIVDCPNPQDDISQINKTRTDIFSCDKNNKYRTVAFQFNNIVVQEQYLPDQVNTYSSSIYYVFDTKTYVKSTNMIIDGPKFGIKVFELSLNKVKIVEDPHWLM
jgi:hypothetical protein